MSRALLILLLFLSGALVLRAQSNLQQSPAQSPQSATLSSPPGAAQPASSTQQAGPMPPEVSAGQIPPAGFAAPDSEYAYDPTGKRDPFRPWTGESLQPLSPLETPIDMNISVDPNKLPPVAGPTPGAPFQRPVVDEEKYPLLARDVADYKVIGIVWDTGQPRAMVRDGRGRLHTIRPKARFGYNGGVVVAIREGEVVIVEKSPESGRAVTRTVPLTRNYSNSGNLAPSQPLRQNENESAADPQDGQLNNRPTLQGLGGEKYVPKGVVDPRGGNGAMSQGQPPQVELPPAGK